MRLFLIDYENVNSAGLHGIGSVQPEDRVILFYSHAANTLSFEIMDEMLSANVMPERVCLERTGKNALDFQLVTFLGYLIAKDKADAYYIISKDSGYQSAIAFCQAYLGVKVQLKPSLKAAIGNQTKKQKQEAASSKKAAKPQPLAKKMKDAKEQPAQQDAAQKHAAKQKKQPAAVSLRKKTTVIQVQSAAPLPAPQSEHTPEVMPIDLETVLSLIQPAVGVDTATEILHCLQQSHSKTEFHNALQKHFENDIVKQYYRCMKPCFIAFTE